MLNKELFEMLRETLPAQHDAIKGSIESIEVKSGFIIGSIGVFVPIVTALLSNGKKPINYLLYLGMFCAAVALILNIIVLWSKKYKVNPDIKDFYFRNRDRSINYQREKYLSLSYQGLVKNREKLQTKGTIFNLSLVIFLFSIISIIIGLIALPQERNYNVCTYNNYARR